MMITLLDRMTDTDVLVELKRLVERERDTTVHVIAALMEVDARRLYRVEGYPSLFVYCTDVLHFSEHAAYLRIEAALSGAAFSCGVGVPGGRVGNPHDDWAPEASLDRRESPRSARQGAAQEQA